MTQKNNFKRGFLRSSSALSALAMLGAGLASSMVLAAPAAAQDYTRGTLSGTVVDEAGAPVSGATVTVRSNEQGFTNSTTTDASGTFRVTALPTGTYTVTVNAGGSVVVQDPSAQVLAGQTNQYRYTGGASQTVEDGGEAIVVTGTRRRVDDFATTQTGATLDVAELVETIPVARDQTSLILLAPGTTSGDTGFGNLASIGGATVAENAYFVNGLNITDFRNFVGGSLIPFEFYRTLDVKTGGYPAEYGRALGGVTSAVTKSGSNNLEGGAVVVYSPDFLQEDSPATFAAANGSDYTESLNANFYLSGPIIKDRLFFYALYAPRHFEQSDSSITGAQRVTTRSSTPFYGAKIDAVVVEGHRLEFTFFRDRQVQFTRYEDFNPTTNSIGASQGGVVNTLGGNNFIGTYTGRFTDWLTVSGSYGENRNVGLQTANPNLAFITSRINAPTGINTRRVQGSVAGAFADRDVRKVYRGDVDLYVKFFGDHHFRAGFDLEKLSAEENTSRTGGGYDYDFRATNVLRTFYSNTGSFQSEQRAIYLQDAWSLFDNRINLQLGVRNDRFRNSSVTGDRYYDSGDNWAPRIGGSIDVFGDQRTKINAFFGRYYLPVATNTNIRLAGQELFYRQFLLYPAGQGAAQDFNKDGIPDTLKFDANGDPIGLIPRATDVNFCPTVSRNAGERCVQVNSDGVPGPTDTLISQNLKPSYTDEYILGASHRLGGWTFGVDYIRRRLGETLEDVAVDAAVLAYCTANKVAGCENEFTGFHQYVLANPGSDIIVRLDGDCSIKGQCDVVTLRKEDLGYLKAVRKYDAVQFTLDKAFNGLYGFNASYTYTNLRGNYEGAVKSDNNQTDAGLTQDFDQPGFQDGFFGDLANGRKHAFKFYGRIEPLEWLDFGVNVLVESPRKFSCIGNYFDANNFAAGYGNASFYCTQPNVGGTPVTNSAGGTSYLVNRSTAFKSDWNKRIDLGMGIKLGALGDAFGKSQLRIDVFNLLNWKQKLDFNEFGDAGNFIYSPSANYQKVTGYQSPRSVRFTLAMRFGGRDRDSSAADQD